MRNVKEHKENFNKRWNITLSYTPQEAFQQFQQRIVNIFKGISLTMGDAYRTYYLKGIDNIVKEESFLDFCQHYGISEKLNEQNDKITIIDRVETECNEKEFYRLIEVILSLDMKKSFAKRGKETKQYLIKRVKEAIEMSDMDVVATDFKNGLILYPKGEKKLDEELVNKTLSFLNHQSNQHFEEALKFYQDKNPVKSAESLRRSLEEFLRYKLKNQKGLKENINSLQKKLKQNNNKSEVRNIIFQTFNYLDEYFNENSKHQDGNIEESENEFLIYQSGLLMRYINKFDKSKLIQQNNT